MAIEVNVGLDVSGGVNTSTTHRQRDLIARSVLGQIAPAKFTRHTSQYQQADGVTVTEQSLVARLPGAVLDSALRTALHDLATRLQQDCIAVLETVSGEGELIGPRAAAWGAFNREFFTTYHDALQSRGDRYPVTVITFGDGTYAAVNLHQDDYAERAVRRDCYAAADIDAELLYHGVFARKVERLGGTFHTYDQLVARVQGARLAA